MSPRPPTTLGPLRTALRRRGPGRALLALVSLAGVLAVPTALGQERVSVLEEVVEAITHREVEAPAPAESRYTALHATTAPAAGASAEREGPAAKAGNVLPASRVRVPPPRPAPEGARRGPAVAAGVARSLLCVLRL